MLESTHKSSGFVLVGYQTWLLKIESRTLPMLDRTVAKVKMKTASHAVKYSDMVSLAPIMRVPISPLTGDIDPGPTCRALHLSEWPIVADIARESVAASTTV